MLKIIWIVGAFHADPHHETTIFEGCSGVAKGLGNLDEMWGKLGEAPPELNDVELAIVGLSLPRATPGRGRLLVKKGDGIVKTVDLSETGGITLMFDEYNPGNTPFYGKWEMGKDEPPPSVEFVFKAGPDASRVKEAVFIRKVEAGAPAPRGGGVSRE